MKLVGLTHQDNVEIELYLHIHTSQDRTGLCRLHDPFAVLGFDQSQ